MRDETRQCTPLALVTHLEMVGKLWIGPLVPLVEMEMVIPHRVDVLSEHLLERPEVDAGTNPVVVEVTVQGQLDVERVPVNALALPFQQGQPVCDLRVVRNEDRCDVIRNHP